MSMLIRLRSSREGLSESEQSVADWILSHPEEAQYISVQALARSCGVSVATVIRLAQHVGCKGFADFKIELARQQAPGLSAMYEAVGDGDSSQEVVSKVFGGNSRSLDDTLAMLDVDQLDRVARRIARCRRCFIYGFGSSAYVAQDAALRLGHLGVQADAYPGVLETAISSMQTRSKDVAVGISHSGRSMTTVNSLSGARSRGAMTVGISNYPGSPLEEVSDVFFCLSFPESRVRAGALSSRVSQICLIDALYLLVARQVDQTATPQEVDEMVESQFRLPKTPAQRNRKRTAQEQTKR